MAQMQVLRVRDLLEKPCELGEFCLFGERIAEIDGAQRALVEKRAFVWSCPDL
jgi:hypothetical protein